MGERAARQRNVFILPGDQLAQVIEGDERQVDQVGGRFRRRERQGARGLKSVNRMLGGSPGDCRFMKVLWD